MFFKNFKFSKNTFFEGKNINKAFLSRLKNLKYDGECDKKILYAPSYLQMKNGQVHLKMLLKLNFSLFLSQQWNHFPIFLIHLKKL